MITEFQRYAESTQLKPNLGLERITKLLEIMGNPEENLKIIHVAGTNGKGSICRFLQSILITAGFKTGLFSSPCLYNSCDAISVNDVCITSIRLKEIYSQIEIKSKLMEQIPTQFEINTCAAFVFFKQEKCDFCIIETGMGGKDDATNAIKESVLDIFAPIDVDHTAYLGNTIEEIALVKSGIIKKNSVVISSVQKSSVLNILKSAAKSNEFITTDIPTITKSYKLNEVFDYKSIKNIRCGLSGVHQPYNASAAIEAAKVLGIDESFIKTGIENAKNPARFELFGNNKIVFDGAHNVHGIKAFVNSANKYFGDCKKNVIFAVMMDKDISAMLNELKNLKGENTYYTVKITDNDRSESSEILAQKFILEGFNCHNALNVENALLSAENNFPIFVCGSLYLYKEFLNSARKLNLI